MSDETKDPAEQSTKKERKLSEMTSLEFAIMGFERELDRRATELRKDADWLGGKLMEVGLRFDDEGVDATFNSLGELQGNGVEFDRKLGELSVMRSMLKQIKDAIEHDAKEVKS